MKHGAVPAPLIALLLAACGDGSEVTRDSGQPLLDAGPDAMPPRWRQTRGCTPG